MSYSISCQVGKNASNFKIHVISQYFLTQKNWNLPLIICFAQYNSPPCPVPPVGDPLVPGLT